MSQPPDDAFLQEFRNNNPCRRDFWRMVIGLSFSVLALISLRMMREGWFHGVTTLFYIAIGTLVLIVGSGCFTVGPYFLCLMAQNKGRT